MEQSRKKYRDYFERLKSLMIEYSSEDDIDSIKVVKAIANYIYASGVQFSILFSIFIWFSESKVIYCSI